MVKNRLKYIIFLEDDPLDFEVYFDILIQSLEDVEIKRYETIESSFYSKYSPAHTLVLVDLNLAGVKGIDIYKNDLKKYNYTVYAHSSSDNPHDIEACQNVGLPAYFQKKQGKKKIEQQLITIVNFYELNLIKEPRE